MVDFQSRDTRRGVDVGEVDAPDDEEGADDDGAAPPSSIAVIATGGDAEEAQDTAADALSAAGYNVRSRDRGATDLDGVQALVDEFVERAGVATVVTVGGTGVRPEDTTVEAVRPLFSKELPAVGEAFRREWPREGGERVLDSRVLGGVVEATPVFCLPGRAEAAGFAARELVAPEAADIARRAAGQ